MGNMSEKLIGLSNRIAAGADMSNVGRMGGTYGNAAVVVAWACLVHELAPVVLAVMDATDLA